MDIGKAFGFVFDDERWLIKILIGAAVTVIPVVGQIIVIGYSYTVARNVARGVERPLPEWEEFMDVLVRGLIGALISLVYALPLLVLVGCLFAFVGIGASGASERSAGGIAAALSLCLFPLIMIVGLLVGLLSLVATGRYLVADDLGAAFQVGSVVAELRNNIGAWLMLIVLSLLAGVVSSLGLIAFGIGVLFTSFYAQCVVGHGLGQVLRGRGSIGVAQPPAPPFAPPS